MKYKVSVVIPTYKRRLEVISRAINSVLNQTYKNLEIFVIDDSPADFIGSKEIKEFLFSLRDKRIKYIRHSDNMGANVARNTGIKAATGEFIAFLDDDDEWLPDKIEKQLKQFNDIRTGMVYCPYYVIKAGRKRVRKTSLYKGNIYKKLLARNFIGSTSCIVIKKECILDVGMFDENLPASQDYDLYLRVARKYHINFVDSPLMLYHEHENERITKNPYKKLEARKYIYKKYQNSISKDPKIMSSKNLQIAQSYVEVGNFKLAKEHWLYALKQYPFPTKSLIKTSLQLIKNKK